MVPIAKTVPIEDDTEDETKEEMDAHNDSEEYEQGTEEERSDEDEHQLGDGLLESYAENHTGWVCVEGSVW